MSDNVLDYKLTNSEQKLFKRALKEPSNIDIMMDKLSSRIIAPLLVFFGLLPLFFNISPFLKLISPLLLFTGIFMFAMNQLLLAFSIIRKILNYHNGNAK